MKLIYTDTSPYARRCRILLRELGLQNDVEELKTTTRNFKDSLIYKSTPSGKVPALEISDNFYLTESTAISNFLEVSLK